MINLSYRDSRPIYEQIKHGFQQLMLKGIISTGDKIPSVRELASQLTINPNTIHRAYREMEAENYIYSVPGKGSFAADISELRAAKRYELLIQFDSIVSELCFLGSSEDELYRHLKKHLEKSAEVISDDNG